MFGQLPLQPPAQVDPELGYQSLHRPHHALQLPHQPVDTSQLQQVGRQVPHQQAPAIIPIPGSIATALPNLHWQGGHILLVPPSHVGGCLLGVHLHGDQSHHLPGQADSKGLGHQQEKDHLSSPILTFLAPSLSGCFLAFSNEIQLQTHSLSFI